MKHRTSLVVAGLATAIAPLCAQAQKQARTAWGDPDLTGAYSEFTTAPLERAPEYADKEFLAREEYEEFAKNRLEQRFGDDETEPARRPTSLQHGPVPRARNEGVHSLEPAHVDRDTAEERAHSAAAGPRRARDERAAARRGKGFDGPEMRSLTERCIIWSSTQPPILPRGYNSNLQIFQSPGYVIIQGEMGDPRIIPTDGRRLPDKLLPQWNGTSVGHWDGDTLVVETAGFHPESAWRNASENMRVTERIKRVDDDTLEYAFAVTDPDTWAEPWGGVYPLTKLDGLLYEYACTEGNYGMANILSGARTAEKEAATKQ
jgi:hypothetical protein